MALTNLTLYTTITTLKSRADDIDTKYSNAPWNCAAVAAKVTSIKTLLDTNIWNAATSLFDNTTRDSSFTNANMCGLASVALTDTDDAIAKLMQGTGNIGEGSFLDPHIADHLDDIYDAETNCTDIGNKLDHVIADLTQFAADISSIEGWFDTLEDLLSRINRSLGMIGASLGCAATIMNQMAGADMRSVFSNLGVGSAQQDKEASVMSDVLQAVEDHKAETNLLTRQNLIISDVKTNDNWDTDMTAIDTGASSDYTSLTTVTALP
jgi:hypothetical protein